MLTCLQSALKELQAISDDLAQASGPQEGDEFGGHIPYFEPASQQAELIGEEWAR